MFEWIFTNVPIWLAVPIFLYILFNILYICFMVYDKLNGVGFCETPAELADSLGINLFGGIVVYIIYLLIFPLYNILFWTFRLIYWLFHIGVK